MSFSHVSVDRFGQCVCVCVVRTRAFQREERSLASFLTAPVEKWVASSYEVLCERVSVCVRVVWFVCMLSLSFGAAMCVCDLLLFLWCTFSGAVGWTAVCGGCVTVSPDSGSVEGTPTLLPQTTPPLGPHQEDQLLPHQDVSSTHTHAYTHTCTHAVIVSSLLLITLP